MTSRPIRLQKRDRPDFERALREAMDSENVLRALRADPAETETATWLRTEARDAADRLTSAAGAEYTAFLKLRAGVDKRAARRTRPPSVRGRGLLPALAVLVPAISGAAAVIFLLLGGLLGVAGVGDELGHSLILTGWTGAAIAALSLIAAMTGVLLSALRNRAAAKRSHGRAGELERARRAWREALRVRGVQPFLERLLAERPAPGTPLPSPSAEHPSEDPEPATPRRYSSPDFSGPDYSGPDFGR